MDTDLSGAESPTVRLPQSISSTEASSDQKPLPKDMCHMLWGEKAERGGGQGTRGRGQLSCGGKQHILAPISAAGKIQQLEMAHEPQAKAHGPAAHSLSIGPEEHPGMGQGEHERESTGATRWQMTTEGRQGLCCRATAGKVGHWGSGSCCCRHHPQGPPSSFLPGSSIL